MISEMDEDNVEQVTDINTEASEYSVNTIQEKIEEDKPTVTPLMLGTFNLEQQDVSIVKQEHAQLPLRFKKEFWTCSPY